MNKRQRKKQVKKRRVAIDTEIRGALASFIGQRLTSETQMKIMNIVGETIRHTLSRPSFVNAILPVRPSYIAPFRRWRELGAGQLTHHVGTFPYVRGDGSTAWKRLCDDETVDSMYILNSDEAVNCFGCLAQEHVIHAPTDL